MRRNLAFWGSHPGGLAPMAGEEESETQGELGAPSTSDPVRSHTRLRGSSRDVRRRYARCPGPPPCPLSLIPLLIGVAGGANTVR